MSFHIYASQRLRRQVYRGQCRAETPKRVSNHAMRTLSLAMAAFIVSLAVPRHLGATESQVDPAAEAVLKRARQWAGGPAVDRIRSITLTTHRGTAATGAAAAGVAIGTGLAWWTGRLVAGYVFDVSGRDPLVLGLSAAIVASVAMLATLVPARRAASPELARALRGE
jgi:hypothetical protein